MSKVIAYFSSEADAERALDRLMEKGFDNDDFQIVAAEAQRRSEPEQTGSRELDPDEITREGIVPLNLGATWTASGGGILHGQPGLISAADEKSSGYDASHSTEQRLANAGVPDAEIGFFARALDQSGAVVIIYTDDEQAPMVEEILKEANGRTAVI